MNQPPITPIRQKLTLPFGYHPKRHDIQTCIISLWPETGVFGNGGGRGVVETGVMRLIFRPATATLPNISGADDIAPVGLG